jgi:hypothetical protein
VFGLLGHTRFFSHFPCHEWPRHGYCNSQLKCISTTQTPVYKKYAWLVLGTTPVQAHNWFEAWDSRNFQVSTSESIGVLSIKLPHLCEMFGKLPLFVNLAKNYHFCASFFAMCSKTRINPNWHRIWRPDPPVRMTWRSETICHEHTLTARLKRGGKQWVRFHFPPLMSPPWRRTLLAAPTLAEAKLWDRCRSIRASVVWMLGAAPWIQAVAYRCDRTSRGRSSIQLRRWLVGPSWHLRRRRATGDPFLL